ncbi:MAG: DUF2889 domain-containing protein [Syntrophomonadaceae bacterium]|nr:DUF2889 domain-containing protein [Syntrophomonadaceae bacterium]MDD3889334.1 DUF2889 domain-containing protein [Syntrophomonadaceae bacterium]MDD4549760.1 DUF2889 domain-containing protein [Syntrophomonadaceae bacterium]
MEFLMQRYWHISVVRENDKFIRARTNYSDSRVEMAAVLRVAVDTLKIEAAWLDYTGRPPQVIERRENIESLRGVIAYLGNGLALRKALQAVENDVARSLFNELVIGIVQAETCLYQERGYATTSDYSDAWENFYAGSCRYYSNTDKIKVSWVDYIGQLERENNLFGRFKSQHLYREDSVYKINGTILDSFHHVSTSLELDENLRVIEAEGGLLRVPDKVCQQSGMYLSNIKGRVLQGLTKKELAHLLGAREGCVHLIDLIYDSVRTLELIY